MGSYFLASIPQGWPQASGSVSQQLASFSLNLGPTAAKLVVSLVTPGLLEREAEVRMLVSLTVSGDWPGDPLMLRCTQLVLDKMGGLIVQTEPKLSQAWGEEEENKVTSLAF